MENDALIAKIKERVYARSSPAAAQAAGAKIANEVRREFPDETYNVIDAAITAEIKEWQATRAAYKARYKARRKQAQLKLPFE